MFKGNDRKCTKNINLCLIVRQEVLIWTFCRGRGGRRGTYGSDAVHFEPVTEDEAGLGIVHPAGR